MDPKIIYVESEDDITDVIGKLKQTSASNIQLTPVRGSIALKSLINLRILLRTAKQADKTISIATSDPTIRRLATTANIDTVSASGIREPEPEEPTPAPETTTEVIEEAVEPDGRKSVKKITRKTEEQEEEVIVSSDLEDTAEAEDDKAKKGKKKVPNFDKYRKWIILGAIALVLLIGFIIWAIFIAPSVTITTSIKTVKRNFSDYHTSSLTVVAKEADENISEGKFYLDSYTDTQTANVKFSATGNKNIGETASGTITVSRTGAASTASLTITKGTSISRDGKKYTVSEDLTLPGATAADVEICNVTSSCFKDGKIVGQLKVAAAGQGASYNTTETSGWVIKSGTFVTAANISGGSDKIIKIVTSDDVKKAAESVSTSITCDPAQLPNGWPDGLMVVQDTKKIERKDPSSNPAVDQEVKEGEQATLTASTSCTLFGIEKGKINQFIVEKVTAGLSSEAGRKIFEPEDGNYGAWMVRREANTDGTPTTVKLEANHIFIGPDVSIESIANYAQGKKTNEVRNWLSSMNGVADVHIDTFPFWLSSVPKDTNKVHINIRSQEEN
jgi:hypothetical protein